MDARQARTSLRDWQRWTAPLRRNLPGKLQVLAATDDTEGRLLSLGDPSFERKNTLR